jgi:hypothetical protein
MPLMPLADIEGILIQAGLKKPINILLSHHISSPGPTSADDIAGYSI